MAQPCLYPGSMAPEPVLLVSVLGRLTGLKPLFIISAAFLSLCLFENQDSICPMQIFWHSLYALLFFRDNSDRYLDLLLFLVKILLNLFRQVFSQQQTNVLDFGSHSFKVIIHRENGNQVWVTLIFLLSNSMSSSQRSILFSS